MFGFPGIFETSRPNWSAPWRFQKPILRRLARAEVSATRATSPSGSARSWARSTSSAVTDTQARFMFSRNSWLLSSRPLSICGRCAISRSRLKLAIACSERGRPPIGLPSQRSA